MRNVIGYSVMALIGILLFAAGVARAEDRMMAPKPVGVKPQTMPVEKVQMPPLCPDMAVIEVRFEPVQVYHDSPTPKGRIRITALARNLGNAPFPLSGKLQLFANIKMAEQPFANVPPGGEVKASYEMDCLIGSVGDDRTILAKIVYDSVPQDLSKYGSKAGQDWSKLDCNLTNNEKYGFLGECNHIFPNLSQKINLQQGVGQKGELRPADKMQKVK